MKKILAIDDNEINLELLQFIVNQNFPDFEFFRAYDGSEGIKIARRELPDIVLLDILMPGLDGYEVCSALKNDIATQNIPIIMVSALGLNSEERVKGLNAGADAFISKPFKNNELIAQINVVLRIKAAEDLLRKRNESLEHSIKIQESKYLQSEERIYAISEHVRQFYWETDRDDIFVYVSPVVENILKIPSLKIIGKMKFPELFPLSGNEAEVAGTQTLISEIGLTVGGSKIWLALHSFPYFDNDGTFAGKRGVCYDITQRKIAEIKLQNYLKKIEQYQQKLRKLNKEILLIEERERRKIAESLHDGLGQTLSLAFLKLSAIDTESIPPDAGKTIATASGLLTAAINESRSLTYDLSPPILYELGLGAAIRWKMEQIQKNHPIKTRLTGNIDLLNLNKELSINLYRIISELIQNVIKHAKASVIQLDVAKTRKGFTIVVADDGVGIPAKKSGGRLNGFGLMNIRERIDAYNGNFRIESTEGRGTKAIIEFPAG